MSSVPPAKRRRRMFVRQQRNTTQAVACDILQAREMTRLADEPPPAAPPPVPPTLAQLASTLQLCKHTDASATVTDVPYERIHSSDDADRALRELLAMHKLASQQHGERLPPAVYTDISYSLHAQCGHPFRAADRIRFKVNNLKKRKLDVVLVSAAVTFTFSFALMTSKVSSARDRTRALRAECDAERRSG